MSQCLDIGIDLGYYVTIDRTKLDEERERTIKKMEEYFEYRLQHEIRSEE
jgi:hypothetical protein